MIEGDVSFPVKRPPAAVFAKLSDPEAAVRVAPDAVELVGASGGKAALGSTYELQVKAMGRQDTGTLEVVEYDEGRAIAYAAKSGPGHARIRFELAPDGEDTQVACRYELKLTGMARLMEPVLKKMIAGREREAALRMRKALEAG